MLRPQYLIVRSPVRFEIASAVAVRLTRKHYRVILSHDPFPPVIRRRMAFHDALYDDFAEVDGIKGVLAETVLDIAAVLASPGRVAVTPLQLVDLMVARKLDALIDARMQKYRVTPDLRNIAELTVGLGPNFLTGFNCDVAIETHPSGTGGVVENGMTMPPDGLARNLGVAGKERFIYSHRDGLWRTPVDVGARVYKGITLGNNAGFQVFAPIDGFLRGIARDGIIAPRGVKLIEIDPRGRAAAWTGSDERGRAIAEATARAIAVRATAQRAFETPGVPESSSEAGYVP